jgi:hypothetical protein
MPSHGDYNVIWGAKATFTAAEKLAFLTEADIEIVEWGFVISTAGVWTTLPMQATLEVEDADGGNAVLHPESISKGGSPAVGERIYARPATPIQVGPGKQVSVSCSQVGTTTAGAGAPFVVYRRKSFHPDRQAGDTNATT